MARIVGDRILIDHGSHHAAADKRCSALHDRARGDRLTFAMSEPFEALDSDRSARDQHSVRLVGIEGYADGERPVKPVFAFVGMAEALAIVAQAVSVSGMAAICSRIRSAAAR
jgi:hypothetical protein